MDQSEKPTTLSEFELNTLIDIVDTHLRGRPPAPWDLRVTKTNIASKLEAMRAEARQQKVEELDN